MKSILVTGGAGFIGSRLCAVLVAQGHDVICCDNLFSGSLRNIEPLRGEARFHFLEHDVSAPFSGLDRLDEIYNLACPASPTHYQVDPVRTTRTCVLGALNVLELARHTGASALQASTSEIYGDPQVHPQPESYWGNVNPHGLRSCYDEGKRCAESLFYDYHRQYGVDIRVPRIFNTYGPGMRLDDGRVVSNFIVQALRGDPITLFGDGSQTRSFCYVDDLVQGLVGLMETPAAANHPVNLGNDGEFTVRELAELVIELTGSASRLDFLPLPQDDPRVRRPDLTRARALIGWAPKVALREGLLRSIPYFREALADG